MYWSLACVMLGEALAFRSVALAEIGCVFFACAALFVRVYEANAAAQGRRRI